MIQHDGEIHGTPTGLRVVNPLGEPLWAPCVGNKLDWDGLNYRTITANHAVSICTVLMAEFRNFMDMENLPFPTRRDNK